MGYADFKKIKPDWLINPKTGKKLELDFYSSRLKIAIECQGHQHFRKVSKFKMTNEDLNYQKFKDKIKKDLCKKQNITLIELEYPNNLNAKIVERELSNKLNLIISEQTPNSQG